MTAGEAAGRSPRPEEDIDPVGDIGLVEEDHDAVEEEDSRHRVLVIHTELVAVEDMVVVGIGPVEDNLLEEDTAVGSALAAADRSFAEDMENVIEVGGMKNVVEMEGMENIQ